MGLDADVMSAVRESGVVVARLAVTSGRVRALAIRQIDLAEIHLAKLQEEISATGSMLRRARAKLVGGESAGHVGTTCGADLDMAASRLARDLDRMQLAIEVAYRSESGAL